MNTQGNREFTESIQLLYLDFDVVIYYIYLSKPVKYVLKMVSFPV